MLAVVSFVSLTTDRITYSICNSSKLPKMDRLPNLNVAIVINSDDEEEEDIPAPCP